MTVKDTLKRFKPYFPPALQRLGVRTWQSVEIPLYALLERRALVDARRVVWPVAEVAEFERSKILGPGADEVLIEVAFTVMSPGTERAQLLGLPGILTDVYRVHPGYSGSGIVTAVGKHVVGLQVGDRVAGRIRHGSRDVVSRHCLFRVPDGVPLESAAFIELGIIVLQGIRKARIRPGESVLVLGQGLIGQLANRLSHVAGGAPIVAVARSMAKSAAAVGPGKADVFLAAEELSDETVGPGFDVVIEATGDPPALSLASSLACAGGRVVLLGTPRGSAGVGLGQAGYRPGLTFIGAHITGLPQEDQSNGLWTYRSEGHLLLDLLAQDKLAVDDLITRHQDPVQANEIYEALRTGDSTLLSIIFDWTSYT
jgi:threonine dehydrogenase-like Zn-dependent dehydrogenase